MAKQKIMTFAPQGGSNWSVEVDGKFLGVYDTSAEVQMGEGGECDMKDVEIVLRRHFSIGDEIVCPEYPY